jgi:preprotein translocase subunit SecF
MKILPENTNIDFLSKAPIALIFSVLAIAASIYIWFVKGEAKYGVDYKGGTEIVVAITEGGSSELIREALDKAGVEGATVQSFEKGSNQFSIKASGSDEGAKANIERTLKATFGDKYKIERTDVVGPTIGEELRAKALVATIFGMLGILAYIAFRFEFAFALGAVVAVFHDVIVCTGVYLFMGHEINASTLAAALTIVGYSVNDTIVIFDRVREEILKSKKFEIVELINRCINATLSRTIITNLLTLLSALALLMYGGGAIADLSLYMVVGIMIGTYSTMFIASPIVIAWDRWSQARAAAKGAVGARS